MWIVLVMVIQFTTSIVEIILKGQKVLSVEFLLFMNLLSIRQDFVLKILGGMKIQNLLKRHK